MLTSETTQTFLPKNRRVIAALIAIVLLGAALRFTGLDHESLWNDELERYRAGSQVDLFHAIKFGIHYDTHPPEFRVLMYFTERIFGTSEAALRFPAALAGTLAIFVIFLLGRQLYSNREGLIAALLTAILWCPLYYSQEAGPYSMLFLLSSLTVWLWFQIVRQLSESRQPSRRLIIGYILTGIITCYLHYFGTLLVALQGLAALWLSRSIPQSMKPIISIYFPIALAFLPWVPFAPLAAAAGAHSYPSQNLIADSTLDYLTFFFNNSLGLFAAISLIPLIVFVRRLLRAIQHREHFQLNLLSPNQLLLAWAIVPFFTVYLISLRLSIFTNRNMIIALPAIYLLLARSITRLTPKPIGPAVISVALAVVFMYNLLYVDHYYTQPHKDQFREAVASIVQHADQYPQAYILGYSYGQEYFDYYFQHLGSPLRVDLNIYNSDQVPFVKAAIERTRPEYVWLVSGFITPNDLVLNYFNQNYQRIDQQPFLRAGVWLYQKKSS